MTCNDGEYRGGAGTDPAIYMTADDRPEPHALAEEERLVRSFRYAEAIRNDPQLLLRASDLIAAAVERREATIGEELWFRLLREPLEFIIGCMTADDAEGRLLRSANPFSILIGERSPADRRQTRLEAARRLRTR